MPLFRLGLGLSQLDSQSPVPTSTSLLDSNTVREKDDHNEDDNDGTLLRFSSRDTTKANRDLSIKKLPENKCKVKEKSVPQKGEVRQTIIKLKKSTIQQNSASKAPSPYTIKQPPQ